MKPSAPTATPAKPKAAASPKRAPKDGAEPDTYRNRFTCRPRSLPIRPRHRVPKPTSLGGQVALVVGVAGE